MVFVFAGLAVVLVAVIGLVVVGRETARLATTARPAVFELEEAVEFIAARLPVDVASRLSIDDVRWVLRADVALLESATVDSAAPGGPEIVDEDLAVARILGQAEDDERDLSDGDVVAVLDGRSAYLEAIGAIGAAAPAPADPTDPSAA